MTEQDGDILHFADVVQRIRDQTAVRAGRALPLTRRQFQLLTFFLQHPGEVLSVEQVSRALYGPAADADAEPVVAHIFVRNLRGQLGRPELIYTVRRAGYGLDDPEHASRWSPKGGPTVINIF